jgi:hypothetical protein
MSGLFLHWLNQFIAYLSTFKALIMDLIHPILMGGFKTKALIGTDDIYLDAHPLPDKIDSTISFSDLIPTPDDCLQEPISTSDSFCRHIQEFQSAVEKETSTLDNLLSSLRSYYQMVTTKRRLAMEVPAGFRRSTTHQNLFCNNIKSSVQDLDPGPIDDGIPPDPPPITVAVSSFCNENTNFSSHVINPLVVRSVDKVSSSLPDRVSMTEDYIRACTGFRWIDTVRQHFSELYKDTVWFDTTPPDAILDDGMLSTIRKKARNTAPVPRSSYFGETIHMDIVFSPNISVCNIPYGLLFSDRFSRMTYLYPLQNLTSAIPQQLQAFFAHIGCNPTRLISDFDLKLIGGKAREYLNSLLIHGNAAPANCQDKNGLAELHWQTMVAMARNWLSSAQLPSSFWFYAVCRAAEVCNYLPYKLEDGNSQHRSSLLIIRNRI